MNDFFAAIEFMQRYRKRQAKWVLPDFAMAVAYRTRRLSRIRELACAVPFYGRQAPTADVAKIEAPLLLHFAELDTRINEGWPAYEAALKANNKVYEAYIYPGVNHGSTMIRRPVMTNLPPILPGKGH
ncbi:dienelactone hydrolase family protein [Escherichia coli]